MSISVTSLVNEESKDQNYIDEIITKLDKVNLKVLIVDDDAYNILGITILL